MKSAHIFLAACSALALNTVATAESLQEARVKMFQGTSEGIQIFGPARSAGTAASSSAGAPVSSTGAAATGPSAPAGDTRSLLDRLSAALRPGTALSGEPLNAGKRLDSPAQGIPLPTASSASAAADGLQKGR